MTRYLRVLVEDPRVRGSVELFQELDEDCVYEEAELLIMGQDMVNEEYSWGIKVVDEEDVPEKERMDG